MEVLVKYHSDKARPVEQAHPGEWLDLRTAKEYQLLKGEHAFLDLGVSIKVPHGFEAIMAPRSSTFKKYGILQTNGIGVIDETYSGENDVLKMSVYATRNIIIPAGERIAQFRIQPNQGIVPIREVEHMDGPDRGGFGSTDDKPAYTKKTLGSGLG